MLNLFEKLIVGVGVGTYVGTRLGQRDENEPTLEAREMRALRSELAAQRGIRIPTFEDEEAQRRSNRQATFSAPHPVNEMSIGKFTLAVIVVLILIFLFVQSSVYNLGSQ